jgi:hypothetical protein
LLFPASAREKQSLKHEVRKMEEWKSTEPEVWKPEDKGERIVGVLIEKKPNEASGISARYFLENEKGRFLVWGCAVIDDRMEYVNVGDKVRITYKGKTRNKRDQEVNLFDVEIARNTGKTLEPQEHDE